MSSSRQTPVVVGVDGAPATRSAIRYAATEAASVGTTLRLVHVVAGLTDNSAYADVDRDTLLARGRGILRAAADVARAAAPEVRIQTDLHHGARKSELASAASGAASVVIGGAHVHAIDRVRTGSLAIALVKHTSCPVVVVPDGWHPEPDEPVLVGYKSPDASFDALVNGFELAARHDCGLTILHVWRLPAGYDDVIGARVSAERIEQHAQDAIEALIADLRVTYPGVRVQVTIRHGQPAHELIDLSRHAAAVVLARAARDQVLPHIGSTSRAVLRHSTCPVVFGTSKPSAAPAELVLEADGRLQR